MNVNPTQSRMLLDGLCALTDLVSCQIANERTSELPLADAARQESLEEFLQEIHDRLWELRWEFGACQGDVRAGESESEGEAAQ